ncbi:MAG: type II toxin-antitoxin system RelE/ParE family toxin [Bacteroidetes bacterium]|nr:type II toxin-antitoxin system RelE/ParE family toxin [Bacteroidota bacterium]
MKYDLEIKPRALKDLTRLPVEDRIRMLARIEQLTNGLDGDIKKLKSHEPQYRVRSGNYRALFNIEGNKIVVYRVKDRKESYN